MKIFQKVIFGLALFVVLIIPQTAIAQSSSQTAQCNELKQQIINAGGGSVIDSLPTYCTTGAIYTKFLNGAMYAVGIVAVIATIYGGYLYMTARGNADQAKKGRTVLTWAIIGLVVVVAAAVIVNVVIRAIVENRFV